MTLLYRLTNLTQQYDGRTVLRVPELEIEEGAALALIGPSGAGKSTLLRLLALLEQPAGGSLHYAGRETSPALPLDLRREVTLMFQQPLLLDTTVENNVGYGLRVRGTADPEAVVNALDEVGLSRMAKKRAKTLSGGEQQRVALARAMIIRPRVLLLDEPTAHLDPANIGIIERVLTRLQRQHGVTLVLATHNLAQARRLAGRSAMLLNGDLIEAGPTEQVLMDPLQPETREFIRNEVIA